MNGGIRDVVDMFNRGELKKTEAPSVGEHFGRVSTYMIVDLDTDEVKVAPNTSHLRLSFCVPEEMRA